MDRNHNQDGGASGPVEVPVEPAEEILSLEEGADHLASSLVLRGDRFPHNLFLVSSPEVVLFPELTVPLVFHEPWAEKTIAQAGRWPCLAETGP